MLVFRLIYGYLSTDVVYSNDYTTDFFSSVGSLRKNYASERMFIKQDIGKQAEMASSQKYEKTATVKSKTSQFDSDLNNIKNTTKNFEEIIQYEHNTGNKGNREVQLSATLFILLLIIDKLKILKSLPIN
jgi:hypothetical protein